MRRWLCGGAASLALAACGGGTSQYSAFTPARLLSFGDESSLLTADGRKYSVNVLDSNGARNCTAQPLWVQTVATLYGFVFAECNPNAVATPQALMRAGAGARVADFEQQVAAQAEAAAGGIGNQDLATVLVGTHDVLDLYADFPGRSEAELVEQARQRGERIGQQVNRLVDLGARVIVSTVPDMGLSPFARAQDTAFPGTDRSGLLTRLTAALNGRLRTTIVNDGRYVGLVLADEMVQAMARAPTFFGLVNATAGVCTTAPPDCTSSTLVADGSSAGYLWSDDRHLAYGGQLQLGLLAESRARNNPF